MAMMGKKRRKPACLKGVYEDMWVDQYGAGQEGGTACLTTIIGLPVKTINSVAYFWSGKPYIQTESYCSGCLHQVEVVF